MQETLPLSMDIAGPVLHCEWIWSGRRRTGQVGGTRSLQLGSLSRRVSGPIMHEKSGSSRLRDTGPAVKALKGIPTT